MFAGRQALGKPRFLWGCALGLLLLLPLPAAAEEYLAVVADSDAVPHAEFVAGLERLLAADAGTTGGWTLRVERVLPSPGAADGPVAIVAVGAEAARTVSEANPPVPVLYGLIPRFLADQILVRGRGPRGAIVLDQSPARRFELIAALLPNARRVAVIYGPTSRAARPAIEAVARDRGFALNSREVLRDDELHHALARVLRGADVLLVLPDPVVFSRDVTRNVLLDTYRARVPVIGYSSAWVTAGALAAVYTSPADLGADTAAIMRVTLATERRVPDGVQEPRRFQIGINARVARSLGIVVPDAATVRRRIGEASQE